MAKLIHGKGPYPHHAGDFCGNHLVGSLATRCWGETQAAADRAQEQYLAGMRFGRPQSCETGTTKEMEAQGYVGLYAKEDAVLMSWEEAIPTPPELMEPPEPPATFPDPGDDSGTYYTDADGDIHRGRSQ